MALKKGRPATVPPRGWVSYDGTHMFGVNEHSEGIREKFGKSKALKDYARAIYKVETSGNRFSIPDYDIYYARVGWLTEQALAKLMEVFPDNDFSNDDEVISYAPITWKQLNAKGRAGVKRWWKKDNSFPMWFEGNFLTRHSDMERFGLDSGYFKFYSYGKEIYTDGYRWETEQEKDDFMTRAFPKIDVADIDDKRWRRHWNLEGTHWIDPDGLDHKLPESKTDKAFDWWWDKVFNGSQYRKADQIEYSNLDIFEMALVDGWMLFDGYGMKLHLMAGSKNKAHPLDILDRLGRWESIGVLYYGKSGKPTIKWAERVFSETLEQYSYEWGEQKRIWANPRNKRATPKRRRRSSRRRTG